MTNAELIAAFKALKDAEGYMIYVAPSCIASSEAIEAIRAAADALEAADKRIAELMPKEGEWIEANTRPRSAQFYCSVCHRTCYDIQPTRDKAWTKRCRYQFCPNCGARMKGERR